jgi:arylsulfatase A-like enzyme
MARTLSSALALSLLAPAASAAPPNVVMVVGDDQGWKDYGFMGGTHVRTPNLDKLAADGLVYPRGYVPSSLCRASLASMITGLYPHQHLVTSNDPPAGADGKRGPTFQKLRAEMVAEFEKSPNLPKLLAAAGYVSHQSGKWWEGDACRCGFTAAMTTGDPAKSGRHGDEGLVIGRQGLKPVTDFIDRATADGKPFYVWYAPMMPHQPHTPPDRLLAKYRDKTPSIHMAKYWAMCEWFDETVGDLLGHLDKQGLRDDTLVVYLHDNGWIQNPDQPRFAPKSKLSPYDGGTRTPIVLRWPGKIKPGRSEALASSVDIAPTVLAACGLKATPDMPGLDLRDPGQARGPGRGVRRNLHPRREGHPPAGGEPVVPLGRPRRVEADRPEPGERAGQDGRAVPRRRRPGRDEEPRRDFVRPSGRPVQPARCVVAREVTAD